MGTEKIAIALFGCWLLMPVAPVMAQEDHARPSWSEEVKKTEMPDAPSEQDRPEMGFSVDRSALQGDMPSFQRTPGRPALIDAPPVDEPQIDEPPIEAAQASVPATPDPGAAVADVELIDVARDPPPAPVTAATTTQSEAVDDRLVSLGKTPELESQETSPAATLSKQIGLYKLVRTKAQAPQYPRQALLNKQEGWVDLLVTVASNGRVESVQIIAAEPRRVFERAAIRAARKWQFEAPIDAGLSDPQQGKYRVDFVMD